MKYNFSGFVWSPAKMYTVKILEDINKRYPLLHYYNYTFKNEKDFFESILDIYSNNDISLEKVKNIKIKKYD